MPGIHMNIPMKYLLKVPRHPYENLLENKMKYLLKVPGIHMKCAIKYPRSKNEISIEILRHSYEKHNEISRDNE
jgi:hypothetical protein